MPSLARNLHVSVTPETDRLNAIDVRYRACLDFAEWLRYERLLNTTLTNKQIALHYLGIDARQLERERSALQVQAKRDRRKIGA